MRMVRTGKGAVVTAGLMLVAIGGGVAWAATTVLSDTIKFGQTLLMPGPGSPTFIFHNSTNCHLTSDGEVSASGKPVVFPCVIQGTLTPTGAGYSGSFKTTSKDGTINSNFGLTPSAAQSLYSLKGSGTENETERGVTTTNDATMTGTVKVTTSPRTITGINIKVSEVSTVP